MINFNGIELLTNQTINAYPRLIENDHLDFNSKRGEDEVAIGLLQAVVPEEQSVTSRDHSQPAQHKLCNLLEMTGVG